MYTDYSYWDPNDPDSNCRSELILHDLQTHQETRLTDRNTGKVFAKFNGSQVVFLHHEYPDPNDVNNQVFTLRLLDIATSDEVILATEDNEFHYVYVWDISQECVAWRAKPTWAPPGSWDVFLYHIPTGVTGRVHTPTHNVLEIKVSGCWVAWGENRTGQWAIYARDLSTTMDEVVAEGAHDKILSKNRCLCSKGLLAASRFRNHSKLHIAEVRNPNRRIGSTTTPQPAPGHVSSRTSRSSPETSGIRGRNPRRQLHFHRKASVIVAQQGMIPCPRMTRSFGR